MSFPGTPHKGLRCGDCERVYHFPTNDRGQQFRRGKAHEVCPVCDSGLSLSVKEPTVTNLELFELWDAYRVDRLERAYGTKAN